GSTSHVSYSSDYNARLRIRNQVVHKHLFHEHGIHVSLAEGHSLLYQCGHHHPLSIALRLRRHFLPRSQARLPLPSFLLLLFQVQYRPPPRQLVVYPGFGDLYADLHSFHSKHLTPSQVTLLRRMWSNVSNASSPFTKLFLFSMSTI